MSNLNLPHQPPPPTSQLRQPAMVQEAELLKRPIYVYDIPSTLLPTLTLREEHQLSSTEEIVAKPSPPNPNVETTTSCALCGVANQTVADQRAHAHSDVHRFNLKCKIRNQPTVSEAEFEGMLEGLNESISGSDSSSHGSTDDAPDTLSVLLKKNAILSHPEDEPIQTSGKQGAGKAPIIWFSSPHLPTATSLGVYRALFSNQEQASTSYLPALHAKQISIHKNGKEPHMFLCMIGGGHFAAMIVSLVPKASKQGGERTAAVIAHKTFHRYTTRRKQGGAQSSNDTAKGAAHSAGSSLRRYNEAALMTEIRELLGGWKEYLDTSELLFVRATGTANRRTLFGYEGAPMKSNDPRIRGFPFSTRRATQSELLRCFVELTRMKVSHINESSLVALSSATPTASTTTTPPKAPPPKPTKEEEEAILHSSQLTALIRRSKAPGVLSYITNNSLSPDYTFTPPNHHTPTLLHLAAASSSAPVVTTLLTKARANPTLTTPQQPRTAFELCGDRATRDAFRVARTEIGEEAWDWSAARVPGGLTKSQADEREKREKREKEEVEKEEKQWREKEVRKLKEEEIAKRAESRKMWGAGGRNLGGVVMELGKREEEERGLTAEGRVRLERERRARAAEDRIRRLQGGDAGR